MRVRLPPLPQMKTFAESIYNDKELIAYLKRDVESLEKIIADQNETVKRYRDMIAELKEQLEIRGLSKEILGHLTTY
jgi:hypothetical protein